MGPPSPGVANSGLELCGPGLFSQSGPSQQSTPMDHSVNHNQLADASGFSKVGTFELGSDPFNAYY